MHGNKSSYSRRFIIHVPIAYNLSANYAGYDTTAHHHLCLVVRSGPGPIEVSVSHGQFNLEPNLS